MKWPPWKRSPPKDGRDAREAKQRSAHKLEETKKMTPRVEEAAKQLRQKLIRNEFSLLIDDALRGESRRR